MARIPLSACIITKNEEPMIAGCLESVSFADEIIVVDSHSSDRTREIAENFRGRTPEGREVRPKVIERDWPGHVAQKNFALDQATNEWVIALDADERLSPELRRAVLAVLESGAPEADAYRMSRTTYYLGRWIQSGGWYPDKKIRLFRKSLGRWGGADPHDSVSVRGKVGELPGTIYHYSYRDLQDHVGKMNSYTSIIAEGKFQRGVRFGTLRLVLEPPLAFLKSYVWKLGFLDGIPGFVSATMTAYSVFLKYAKLWELRNVRDRRSS